MDSPAVDTQARSTATSAEEQRLKVDVGRKKQRGVHERRRKMLMERINRKKK